MAQISKNGFDLMGMALHKMKGKWAKGFWGTMMFVLPLALMCCIPYAGWAIALFCWGVLETGYIRFMRRLMNGENPGIAEVFSEVKTGWFELYLGALLLVLFILGSTLIFIPGLVLIGYYSLSLFTAEYFHIEKVGEAMYQTAVRMDGNKSTMFCYKAIFYAVYALVGVALGFTCYGIVLLWAINPILTLFVALVAFVVYTSIWSCITEFFHATNEMMFQEILTRFEYKNTDAFREAVLAEDKEKDAEVANEEAKVEVKEETKEAPKAEKSVKKATPKKAPAKKPAPKKPAVKK